MSGRSLAEWADIVAEVATRRGSEWQRRLKRPIEYPRDRLKTIATNACRAGILNDDAGLQVAESGFLAHEVDAGWQQEWNLRNRVVAGRG